MIKKSCSIIVIILLLSITGCSKSKGIESIYEEYSFDDVIYLSPLSSSSIDYIKGNMDGAEFIITKDLFQISSKDVDYELKNPIYEEKKFGGDISNILSEKSLGDYKDKAQYTILSNEKEKSNYYLFTMDDEVWIAVYSDNTADGSDLIISIYKLEKSK